MLVYRVEYEDGIGPYQSRNRPREIIREIAKYLHEAYYDHDNHQCIIWEDVRGFESKHVCGFVSLSQFFYWFTKEMREFLYIGEAKLATYHVYEDNIIFGRFQIAFDKSKAKLIGTKPIPYE